MKKTKRIIVLSVLFTIGIASVIGFVACGDNNEEEYGQKLHNKTASSTPNMISLGRAHNEILYRFLTNMSGHNIFNFEILNDLNDSNLFGIQMDLDQGMITDNIWYQTLNNDFSYQNVRNLIVESLNAKVASGDITPEFKEIMLSFYPNGISRSSVNIRSIIETLSAYTTTKTLEESILQSFGYTLIYSYSLWTTYNEEFIDMKEGEQINYISVAGYTALMDAAGYAAASIGFGPIIATGIASYLSSVSQQAALYGKVCLCWGGDEPECRQHHPIKIVSNHDSNNGELGLTDEALEMLSQLSENHPPMSL